MRPPGFSEMAASARALWRLALADAVPAGVVVTGSRPESSGNYAASLLQPRRSRSVAQ